MGVCTQIHSRAFPMTQQASQLAGQSSCMPEAHRLQRIAQSQHGIGLADVPQLLSGHSCATGNISSGETGGGGVPMLNSKVRKILEDTLLRSCVTIYEVWWRQPDVSCRGVCLVWCATSSL